MHTTPSAGEFEDFGPSLHCLLLLAKVTQQFQPLLTNKLDVEGYASNTRDSNKQIRIKNMDIWVKEKTKL